MILLLVTSTAVGRAGFSGRAGAVIVVVAAELAKDINDFLRTISLDERNTFVGRYWFLLSVKELSVKTGFSEGKIKILLYRTRKKLKDYLKRKEY